MAFFQLRFACDSEQDLEMGKLRRVLDTFCLSFGSNTCFCMNSMEFEDEFEKKPLIVSDSDHKLRLKDVVGGKQTLAFQLKPQVRPFFFLFQLLL